MSEVQKEQSWWTTIPGMLTALGTFIGAITGLIVALNQIGFIDFKTGTQETKPANSLHTGDPYTVGTVPDREIEKIISHAAFKFEFVKGDLVSSDRGSDVYRSDLKFSGCKESPTIHIGKPVKLLGHPIGVYNSWSCRVHSGTTNVHEIIKELDILAKQVANALPPDWKIKERPRGTSEVRLSAEDPTGTPTVDLRFSESSNDIFSGTLSFQVPVPEKTVTKNLDQLQWK
jgi:hypothetical protein